jgi:hypothetical protein
MARRDISTKQAGYIDADFLHPPTFPLQSDEIDEKEAAKAPFTASPLNGGWGEIRLRDGTVIKQ